MSNRSLWFVASIAVFTACSSSSSDDGPGGPFDSLPDALSDSATGPIAGVQTDTEVWSVDSQWLDRDTPAAREKGVAWDANSGLTWEEKFGRWVSNFEKIRNASDSSDTIK